jgi:hypothetical protein
MILISHRGNLNGPNPEHENSPQIIKSVLSKNYHCEIDVWHMDGHFSLGHDKPSYPIEDKFLENDELWCHAKNLSALEKMLQNSKIHCFWHQNDAFTITSRKYIWTYPGKPVGERSVIVSHSKKVPTFKLEISGICSDYIEG